MEIVHSDLRAYLKKNIFPCRTVLVFPPFNGFRRFLIHKLIEDNFSSSEVAAFSIGQDISRRIVVCYKGLIRDGQDKVSIGAVPRKSGISMIEKEKQSRQKLTPTAAVYRPPAARLAESRRSLDDQKPSDAKRKIVRRPDQQMYVPRPKRISYGNEQPRSRSRSSSRTSLDSDSCDKKKSSSSKSEESRLSGSSEVTSDVASDSVKRHSIEPTNHEYNNLPSSILNAGADVSKAKDVPDAESANESRLCEDLPENDLIHPPFTSSLISSDEICNVDLPKPTSEEVLRLESIEQLEPVSCPKNTESTETHAHEKRVDCTKCDNNDAEKSGDKSSKSDDKGESSVKLSNEDNRVDDKMSTQPEVKSSKPEAMETISISSDSRGDQSSSSCATSSSNDSRNSDSSSDSESALKPKAKSCEKMEVERSTDSEKKKNSSPDRRKSQEQNMKNRRIFPTLPVSDVLIISDTSSSNDSLKTPTEHESRAEVNEEKNKKSLTVLSKKDEKPTKKNNTVDPDECDWESLYDDSGECLVPDLMEELTTSVGRVRVTSVESDYRPYQSIEERTSDGECVIEIYDFPSEFKTTDLFNIFAAYRNKNFQIKWVDDTHALGVFPSPLIADEVLASTLPFVKTRPLRLGIVESRNKARNLILPPLPSMERPKTCTALARRLVSGALGLRLPTSSQEREKEKQVLKEAREKRRLEAKQREAAWDGTLTSGSCI